MISLTDRVNTYLHILKSDGKTVDLHLSDDLPKMYDSQNRNLILAVSNLFSEIAMPTRGGNTRRVITTLDGNLQRLEVAWDGVPLDYETLAMINRLYQTGAALDSQPRMSGTKMAGYFFARLGGQARIENFEDGIYRVKNVVELPVNY